jgi:hypothetical protein
VIQLTPQMRLLLAVEPVGFRKGIDGLEQVCRQKLNTDPLAGALFVFANRRRKALNIMVYDDIVVSTMNEEQLNDSDGKRGRSGAAARSY